ncbi:hypothetical protein [Dyadobacter sp. CY356]|uniref:hypothetical protein n=1 Tax=Dyadobacter sp. CY356 TaxID=2906442 RepID=UPI001F17A971|nr:hypothetical protein [Dyadobacter sp. CY356]MCF0057704.1 hypothetical protein [Dyadobacter sp. CY356]
MKKHPVDDLFKKRLNSLEKQPSELAWERIQQGQKNKSRRIAAWVWYAAASVSMALISGYAVWQNQSENSGKPSNQTEMAMVEKTIPETGLPEIPEAGKTNKTIARADKEGEVLLNKSSVKVVQNSKLPADRKIREVVRKAQDQEIKEIREKDADIIQVTVIKTTKPEETKTDIQQPVLSEKVNTKSVEVAQVEDKKADRTIVVEIEEPKNEFKDKKPSRLARVFRQLKNVREAEPVDWDDVGFNPKNILARVDDRPNTNDEKVSGKRERKN